MDIKKSDTRIVIDKAVLDDRRLSWGAKGLFCIISAKLDTESIKITDLVKAKESKDEIQLLLDELIQCGYIERGRVINE